MRSLAVVIACLGLGLVMLAPGAAGAKVRHCSYTMGHGPTNDRSVPLGNVATRNMICSKALGAIHSGKLNGTGNLKTDGFTCKVTKSFHAAGTLTGADVSCAAGTRSFSFSWAT